MFSKIASVGVRCSGRTVSNQLFKGPLLMHSTLVPGISRSTATSSKVCQFSTVASRVRAQTLGQAWQNRAPGMSSTRKALLTLLGTGGLIAIGGIAVAGRTTSSLENAVDLDFWPEYVQQRVQQTYGYVAMGLSATAGSAALMYQSGLAHRIVRMNPWVFMGGSLLATVGSMMFTMSMPEGSASKPVALMLFNTCMGASLCSLGFVGSSVLIQAAMGTTLMVGGLSLVAANSPSDKFLWMGGPLTVGLGVVVISSFGTMFFPASSIMHHIALYGGLGLFGGFMLFDTSKLITNAKHARHFDPVNESIHIYMNTVNIFVRMVAILGGNRKK